MSLLAAEGLDKSFGGVVAARNVTFAVEAGKLLAIIGPNGAGKSTIFNMVGGQLQPTAPRGWPDRKSPAWRPAASGASGSAARSRWRRPSCP
jgi:ABC-type branched-subunit amino acid transport system ATPase component